LLAILGLMSNGRSWPVTVRLQHNGNSQFANRDSGTARTRHIFCTVPMVLSSDPSKVSSLLTRAAQLFRLSIPLAAVEIPVAATVAIDTILLGRLGASAVAAGGIGAAVFIFVASIGVSIISSVGHEAAYRAGKKDQRNPLPLLRPRQRRAFERPLNWPPAIPRLLG